MNKIFISAFAVLVGLFFVTAVPVSAQTAEVIHEYAVDITVNTDSSIRVEETIRYDFGNLERHGIFRTIPYKYKARGGNFELRISDIEVSNGNGQTYQYAKSKSGGELELKIGDPDGTISGEHTYKIAYTVGRAINYFENDHDELYWNAIGAGWEVPIEQSRVTVHLPVAATNAVCFIGEAGSTNEACAITGGNNNVLVFDYPTVLQPGEGFTIAVAVPYGTLTQPTTQQKIWDFVKDNGILALPIFVFGFMFYLWRKHGKDAQGRGTIVAQYDAPDGMSPLYMGALVDTSVDNKDLSAELIYLATKGFLKISKIETKKLLWFKGSDYSLTKLKDPNDTLAPQTRALQRGLFAGGETVTLTDLKTETLFKLALAKINMAIFEELTTAGYYRKNPQTVKTTTIALGVILGIGGSVFIGLWLESITAVIATVLSSLIIIVFGWIMPARTAKGSQAREHILGLKEYLSVAESERLKFHNAPEKNPAQFEKLLPHAIALGVETAWAKQFEGVYKTQPGWYNDPSSTAFNSVLFASSIHGFSDSVQSAMATATSSSGGSGFSGGGSGGGGGGGGGGSW